MSRGSMSELEEAVRAPIPQTWLKVRCPGAEFSSLPPSDSTSSQNGTGFDTVDLLRHG